jgi:hypothetical protein
MRALVVYESMFGNTQEVAEAVAAGLSGTFEVEVKEIADAPATLPAGVDLLVLGGPTHAFGLTREQTRQDAAGRREDPLVSRGPGLREWLEGLVLPATTSATPSAATFDTRIAKPRFPGSAAKGASRRLRRLGFRLVESESFWVKDVTGPLIDGEPERARAWGEHVGVAAAHPGREHSAP